MKTLLALLSLALVGIAYAADTPAPSPRIVTIAGCTYPKAEIIRVVAQTGTLFFRWLKADGTPADSGNSVARFTPVAPVEPVPPNTAPTYPPPTDATLRAAIAATQ